jgi:hypothetical protein
MLFRPSAKTRFRNAAIGAGLVTLAAVGSFAANAQQAVSYSGPAACAPYAGTDRETKCLIEQSQIRTQQYNQQTKALDAQARLLADEKTCLSKLLEFKKASPDKFKELGPISRANACEAASRIPKPTAEAAPRVGG